MPSDQTILFSPFILLHVIHALVLRPRLYAELTLARRVFVRRLIEFAAGSFRSTMGQHQKIERPQPNNIVFSPIPGRIPDHKLRL
jgi:hypothetical protein